MIKKIKIAQITMNGYSNYGNILQKFALHHTLKKFADFTEVLWFGVNKLFPETGEKSGVQYVIRKKDDFYRQLVFLRDAVRQSKFKDFENLNIRTRFDFPFFEEIADEYDFFVVGSDQVWNPSSSYFYTLLNFVPREKKVSYAASIGVDEIPDDKKESFCSCVSDFNYISVREETAVKIIGDLMGRTSLLVFDPVLLLTKNEWLAVAQKPTWFKERYSRGYVLTYYIGKTPPSVVNSFADKLNLPVINLLNTENYNHFTVGPAEFIWLFTHASLVYTNSFHGAAFATLFKHPFVLNALRKDNDPRFLSLLKMFGLGDRFNPAEPMEIDFSSYEEVLSSERAKAFNFLAEAFGVNPREKFADTNQSYFPMLNLPSETFGRNSLERLLGGDA